MLRITLNKNDGGQRLDKFLQKSLKGLPTALMYKYIRKKRVKVNGKRAKENQILQAGDLLELYIPEEFSKNEANIAELERIRTQPRIVYEDENILICDKQPGVLSHTFTAAGNIIPKMKHPLLPLCATGLTGIRVVL